MLLKSTFIFCIACLSCSPIGAFPKNNSDVLLQRYKANPAATAQNVEELFMRALVQMQAGNAKAALEDYSKVLKLEPNDSDTLANRCGIFIELNENAKAIEDCQKALQNGGSPIIFYNLGLAQERNLLYTEAVASYNKVLQYAKERNDTNLLSQIESRQSLAQKVVNGQLKAEAVAKYWNGNEKASQGDLQSAQGLYEKAAKVSSNFPELYLELANVCAMQQKYNQALAHYAQAERLNPSLLAIYNNRAAIYLQAKGDKNSAIKELQKAKNIAEKSGQLDAISFLDRNIKELETNK